MNFIEWEVEDFCLQDLFLQEISPSGLLIISCFVLFFFFPQNLTMDTLHKPL